LPALSLLTLNLFGKLGFGALGGFEYVAIHAGECRQLARAIGRSIVLAAPVIALMFILGTSSIIALIPQDELDKAQIAPIPTALTAGFSLLGPIAVVAPIIITALLYVRLAKLSVMFTGNTRLPMVTGWDQLLPDWLVKLHHKRKTPVNSIVFVGVVTLVMGILVQQITGGKDEAFQILWNASGACYALTYLAMFAVPLIEPKSTKMGSPIWLKVSAIIGLSMTLLYIMVSPMPIIEVTSPMKFGVLVSVLVVITNVTGLAIYRTAKRKHHA
jgi:glutamate:GABA antiporter